MKKITTTQVVEAYKTIDGCVFVNIEEAKNHEEKYYEERRRIELAKEKEHKQLEELISEFEIKDTINLIPYGIKVDPEYYEYHWYNIKNESDLEILEQYYGTTSPLNFISDYGIYCLETSGDGECSYVLKASDMIEDLQILLDKLGNIK